MVDDTAVFQTSIPGGNSIDSDLRAMMEGSLAAFVPIWGAAILI